MKQRVPELAVPHHETPFDVDVTHIVDPRFEAAAMQHRTEDRKLMVRIVSGRIRVQDRHGTTPQLWKQFVQIDHERFDVQRRAREEIGHDDENRTPARRPLKWSRDSESAWPPASVLYGGTEPERSLATSVRVNMRQFPVECMPQYRLTETSDPRPELADHYLLRNRGSDMIQAREVRVDGLDYAPLFVRGRQVHLPIGQRLRAEVMDSHTPGGATELAGQRILVEVQMQERHERFRRSHANQRVLKAAVRNLVVPDRRLSDLRRTSGASDNNTSPRRSA